MFKKISLLLLICVVVSCAFSTQGTIATGKIQEKYNKQQDTPAKYIERPVLTAAQQAKRDSIYMKYIGKIIQPYIDDIKSSNTKSITNLTQFIQGQGNKLDSLNALRYKETYNYQIASAQRDSFLIQSIFKDKRIDSLQNSVNHLQYTVKRIEQTNVDANKITEGLTTLIFTIRDLFLYTAVAFILISISLTLILEFAKSRHRKRLKLIKQDE